MNDFEPFAQAALSAYDLPAGTQVRRLHVSENGTFVIEEPDGRRSALRVHREGYHSREAILSELNWTAALRQDDVVRTPAVLPTRTGERVHSVRLDDGSPSGQERYVVRFEWVDGTHPHEDRLERDFAELGAIAARLHQYTKAWTPPPGFTRFTWNYDTSIGEHGLWGRWQDGLGVGPSQQDLLLRLQGALRDRLREYGCGPDVFGLVHADMRLANLLVSDTHDDVTVIDFDDCGFSWYMYDAAASLSFIEHEPYVPDLLTAWVTGYREVAPLSERDVAILPTLVMLRRLLLVAWIGSHHQAETAQELGEAFTHDTCILARAYLEGALTKAMTPPGNSR